MSKFDTTFNTFAQSITSDLRCIAAEQKATKADMVAAMEQLAAHIETASPKVLAQLREQVSLYVEVQKVQSNNKEEKVPNTSKSNRKSEKRCDKGHVFTGYECRHPACLSKPVDLHAGERLVTVTCAKFTCKVTQFLQVKDAPGWLCHEHGDHNPRTDYAKCSDCNEMMYEEHQQYESEHSELSFEEWMDENVRLELEDLAELALEANGYIGDQDVPPVS